MNIKIGTLLAFLVLFIVGCSTSVTNNNLPAAEDSEVDLESDEVISVCDTSGEILFSVRGGGGHGSFSHGDLYDSGIYVESSAGSWASETVYKMAVLNSTTFSEVEMWLEDFDITDYSEEASFPGISLSVNGNNESAYIEWDDLPKEVSDVMRTDNSPCTMEDSN